MSREEATWDSQGELISVPTSITYLHDDAERCLVANGKMYAKRNLNGQDDERVGVKVSSTQLRVHNARQTSASLDKEGFTLTDAPTAVQREGFDDIDVILRQYYPECAALVKKITGASLVAAFDHNVRSVSGSKAGKRIKGGAAQLTPIQLAHGDYTINGSPLRLQRLTEPPGSNDEFRKVNGNQPLLPNDVIERSRKGSFAIVNVWRSIMDCPLEKQPLAMCDAQTVHSNDLSVFEVHYADRVGENYFVSKNPEHKWFYYPRMTPSEALLFKQWDSKGTLVGGDNATFSLHASFKDITASEGAKDRESIEVRCICIFDEVDTVSRAPATVPTAPKARL